MGNTLLFNKKCQIRSELIHINRKPPSGGFLFYCRFTLGIPCAAIYLNSLFIPTFHYPNLSSIAALHLSLRFIYPCNSFKYPLHLVLLPAHLLFTSPLFTSPPVYLAPYPSLHFIFHAIFICICMLKNIFTGNKKPGINRAFQAGDQTQIRKSMTESVHCLP